MRCHSRIDFIHHAIPQYYYFINSSTTVHHRCHQAICGMKELQRCWKSRKRKQSCHKVYSVPHLLPAWALSTTFICYTLVHQANENRVLLLIQGISDMSLCFWMRCDYLHVFFTPETNRSRPAEYAGTIHVFVQPLLFLAGKSAKQTSSWKVIG